MTSELSEWELIARCSSGSDEGAWDQFVRKFGRVVWAAIHRTFRASSFSYTAEDAEDLFGAVFLSLMENGFRSLREFQGRNACSLSTWLTVVTSRRTIDYMRRVRVRRQHFLEDLPEAAVAGIADGRESVETVLADDQRYSAISRSLQALSEEDQRVFDVIRKGLAPESAAQALGMTVSAFYTRKHRLIERLKKSLDSR